VIVPSIKSVPFPSVIPYSIPSIRIREEEGGVQRGQKPKVKKKITCKKKRKKRKKKKEEEEA
jgi:hypothetical protein